MLICPPRVPREKAAQAEGCGLLVLARLRRAIGGRVAHRHRLRRRPVQRHPEVHPRVPAFPRRAPSMPIRTGPPRSPRPRSTAPARRRRCSRPSSSPLASAELPPASNCLSQITREVQERTGQSLSSRPRWRSTHGCSAKASLLRGRRRAPMFCRSGGEAGIILLFRRHD